jgi:hypothetical protein
MSDLLSDGISVRLIRSFVGALFVLTGTISCRPPDAPVSNTIGAVDSSVPAQETPEIDIKGIRLGMAKQEVDAQIGSPEEFTIARIPCVNPNGNRDHRDYGLLTYYVDDKLDSLAFFFSTEQFDDMVEALRLKYPQLDCKDSVNQDGIDLTACILEGKSGNLLLHRHYFTVSTSVLFLQTQEAEQRRQEAARKQEQEEHNKLLEDL